MSDANQALAAHLRTGWFVACDPGTQYPAVAIFDRGALVHASRVKVPYTKLRELEEGERVRQIVKMCWEYTWAHAPAWARAGWTPPLAVVHEWPKAYSGGKSKNSADQLFPLAAIGAGLAIRFDAVSVSPIPFSWIGNVPKNDNQPDGWDSARGRMIKTRLRPEEVAAIALKLDGMVSHDAVDAAGLGLWSTARLDKVYPGTV